MAAPVLDLTPTFGDQVCLAFWPEGAPPPHAQGRPAKMQRREQGDLQLDLPGGAVTAVLPRTQLISHSPYWAAQLEGAWEQQTARDKDTGWPVLVEKELSVMQLAAAKALAAFLSTERLQAGQSMEQLWQVYQLAQRFDVPRCREACLKSMRALPVDELSVAEVTAWLELLPELPVDQQRREQERCIDRLIWLFKDVNKTLNSDELLHAFKMLPLEAIMPWAVSSQLQLAGSENDVAAAVGEWVQAQPEGSVSAEQVEKLCARVRVSRLTLGYRLHLLSQDWFRPKDKLISLMGLLDGKGSRALAKWGKDNGLPHEWLPQPHRPSLSEAEVEARRTYEFYLSEQQLEEALQEASGGQECVRYFAFFAEGHKFFLAVQVDEWVGGYNSRMIDIYQRLQRCSLAEHSAPLVIKYELSHSLVGLHGGGGAAGEVAWQTQAARERPFAGGEKDASSTIIGGELVVEDEQSGGKSSEGETGGKFRLKGLHVRCKILKVE